MTAKSFAFTLEKLWIICFAAGAAADSSSSTVALVESFAFDQTIVKVLKDYQIILERSLSAIQRYTEEYDNLFGSFPPSDEGQLKAVGDPLRSYVLLKRLGRDWPMIRESLGNSWKDVEDAVEEAELKAPETTWMDVGNGWGSLGRLHNIYQLDPYAIVTGSYGSPQMGASDIAGVAMWALQKEKYQSAVEWLTLATEVENRNTAVRATANQKHRGETVRPLISDAVTLDMNKTDVRLLDEKLSEEHESLNRRHLILLKKVASKMLRLSQAQKSVHELSTTSSEEGNGQNEVAENTQKGAKADGEGPVSQQDSQQKKNEEKVKRRFRLLCQGKTLRTEMETRHLKCRYDNRGSPYLRLNPVRLEEVNLDPLILIFHNIVSRAEMLELQETAIPLMQRASVGAGKERKGTSTFMDGRVSMTAWLRTNLTDLVRRMDNRAARLTGLTINKEDDDAEPLQMNNYATGGHYDTHTDHFDTYGSLDDDNHPSSWVNTLMPGGDRIATLMFYLSDVEQGGLTAFPLAGAAVEPEAGSAIFWFNLLPSGRSDDRTKHGGCPVIKGTKWVANKWIHFKAQFKTRPCALQDL